MKYFSHAIGAGQTEKERLAAALHGKRQASLEKHKTDEVDEKVLASLGNAQWDFRTIEAITRETGLSETDIASVISRRQDLIRESFVPDRRGRRLYTLRARPVKPKERLALLRVILAKSVS